MRIGSRTPEELRELLQWGYFSNGRQRITSKVEEGAPMHEVRLWDNWEQRQSHIYASDITLLLEVAHLDISDWLWRSYREE